MIVDTFKATIYNKMKKGGCDMKVDRLMSIALVLLDKKRIRAQELADMFEVSLRTIYRDIDAIDLAGIPIRSIPGVHGGFEIMPKYKLDHKVFTASDLSAILMGLTSLSGMLHEDELLHALTKIKSFIPAEQAKEIELRMNQIHIDLTQWMGNRNIQPYVECIKTALQENRLLTFTYIALHGCKSERIVEPYQLVLKGNQWYLYGYCHTRKEYRFFRLSRMSNLVLQKESFLARVYPKPQLDFHEELSAIQIEIKIRIHSSILDRVLDYCSFEHMIPDGDAHYIVNLPFVDNEYHYDMLLSFGNRCECLEPSYVREKLIQKIQSLSSLYKLNT